MKRNLVWFTRDLRIHDNVALQKAAEHAKIIPLYVLNLDDFKADQLGFPRIGKYRGRFLYESLIDLKQNLKELGGDLLIINGDPHEVVPGLAKKYQVEGVYSTSSTYYREFELKNRVGERLEQANINFHQYHQYTLFHPEDIPFNLTDTPDIFTEFRKKLEKNAQIKPAAGGIEKIALVDDLLYEEPVQWYGLNEDYFHHPRQYIHLKGGESQARQRLAHYFWQADELQNYKWTRNGLMGMNYSSKFSAWLSLGCISSRQIYQEVKRYEQERKKNISTYWLIFELIWRDFFQYMALKHGERLELVDGIKSKRIDFSDDHTLFEKWCTGQTGQRFIDANMKEINATGYMSNRGRQNVASYLVKDLKVNWTWGAKYFESLLIDYDPASNWGNWNYVAGVGNDPRENRYFNPEKQAKKYDPEDKYQDHWLTE